MATGIQQVHRPRIGYVAPLAERWKEACARLEKVSPGHPAMRSMMSELGIDAIDDAVRACTPKYVEPDPALKKLRREYSDLERRYHAAWMRTREVQNQLRRTVSGDVHAILQDVPANWHEDVGPTLDTQPRPALTSTRVAREAIGALNAWRPLKDD
jgi:hypothetical protein